MIILDTNALSELMRAAPAPRPLAWLARQSRPTVFTTAISHAEIFFGLRSMSDGRRRLDLEQLASSIFREDFLGRVLAFDGNAARPLCHDRVGAARDGATNIAL